MSRPTACLLVVHACCILGLGAVGVVQSRKIARLEADVCTLGDAIRVLDARPAAPARWPAGDRRPSSASWASLAR